MNAALRFVARRPPRTGWLLFGLALLAVLMLVSLVVSGSQNIAAGPMLLAVSAGLLLGLAGDRWLRALALIMAALLPLLLLDLAPPLTILLDDLRALLSTLAPRPPFMLPEMLERSVVRLLATLQAAWQGNPAALVWAIAKLDTLLGYAAALVLGMGLRHGTRLIAYVLPLLAAIATVGITARAGTFHILAAVFPALLLCVVGDFVRRERAWERAGVDYSYLLRSDVAVVGAALAAAAVLFGVLTPSAARNALTSWLWTGARLPAGLAQLDTAQGGAQGGINSLIPGGYRAGQTLELGQSLQQGNADQIAFTIQVSGMDASSLPYWRGRILDEYTGRRWTTGPIRNITAVPFASESALQDVIVQQVRDQRAGSQLRYGLPDIVALDTGGSYEQNAVGTTASWLGNEQQYTVYSNTPEPLDFAGPEAIESQRIIDSQLVLPETLPQRVRDLARQITAGTDSQTARAEAIESYLRELPYSYEVEPLMANGDAVDQFLFTMRRGYCTYYASAMALLARAVGIPSRVAIGYATGEYDAASQRFVVREADAHAWPELYIDGQGWTRWEPTPVRPIPARSSASERPRSSVAAPAPQPQPAAGISPWWLVIVLVLGLVLLLAMLSVRRLVLPLTPAGVHADLFRWGKRAGVTPRAADSIEEYGARLARSVPGIGQPLQSVARLLTARAYRSRPLDAEEEATLVGAWGRARDVLRRRRR